MTPQLTKKYQKYRRILDPIAVTCSADPEDSVAWILALTSALATSVASTALINAGRSRDVMAGIALTTAIRDRINDVIDEQCAEHGLLET